MIKNLLILIALIITISSQAQVSYYVDATGGNDNNDGISPATAWQTIDKINQQTFAAGDSILFKRGEIWRGELKPQNSGNSNNWIVFSDYGTGARPQLLGSEEITDWVLYSGNVYKKSNLNLPSYAGDGLFEFDSNDPIILIEDTGIPTLAGHYYYDANQDNGTIYIYCSDSLAPSTHNIEISMYENIIYVNNISYLEFSDLSLKFGNCKNIMMYSTDYINIKNINSSYQGHYGNPNIFIMGSNHVVIENCVLYKSYNSGIAFYPIGTTRPGHYNTVRGCNITKVYTNDGITIHEDSQNNSPGNYYLIENNVIGECKEGSIDASSDYLIFRNNICFNNVEDAFQIGSSGDHVIFENNICYGNARHGLLAYGNSSTNSKGGHIIRNNVIYDMVKHCLYTGPQRYAIYNNTICNSAKRSEVIFFENPMAGSVYKNNIVYNDNYNSLVRFYSTGLPSSLEMDYNNYNVIKSDSLIIGIAQTNTKHTLSQIQNIYNRELNSVVINPGFVDALNKDYHLSTDSPCIDAGGFLTKTTSVGSGNQIPVEDIIYFFDGFGIVGGDTIQLQGQTQKLVIKSIDTTNNIITVNQSISWNIGDGVALSYSGTTPDIGAYEYITPVGIITKQLNNNLLIYPNPTNSEIYFSNELLNHDFQIISVTGSIVKRGVINGNKILLKNLKAGLYFINIINPNSKEMNTFKLIKE